MAKRNTVRNFGQFKMVENLTRVYFYNMQ